MQLFRGLLLVVTGAILLLTSGAVAYLHDYDPDDLLLGRLLESKRDQECALTGSKCFNSGQCCVGLICASVDEDSGEKPEVPGYCVRSKDVQPCHTDESCSEGQKCMTLGGGRGGQMRVCLRVPPGATGDSDYRSIKMTDRRRFYGPAGMKSTMGKLGSLCVTDGDCAPRSDDGQKMCCQSVNRGRQGAKQICDRVSQISSCISA